MVYVRFEPQYEASTLLEIHEHPQYIAFETGQGGGQGFFRTQMELIRSRWILGLTAANDKVKQLPEICKAVDPIEWLKKRVTVVQANGSNVFEIKYTGADAEAASTIVNELTRQYLTTQEEEGAKSTRDIVAALTREMELREKEVHDLQNQVRVATQEVSGKEPEFSRPDPASPFRNPLGELQNRLIGIQVDRTMLTAKIAAAEEELRGRGSSSGRGKGRGQGGRGGNERPERGRSEGPGGPALARRNRPPRRHGGAGPGCPSRGPAVGGDDPLQADGYRGHQDDHPFGRKGFALPKCLEADRRLPEKHR